MTDHPSLLSPTFSIIELLQLLKLIDSGLESGIEHAAVKVEKNHQRILQVLTDTKLAGQFYKLCVDTPIIGVFPCAAQDILLSAYQRQHEINQRYLTLLVTMRDLLAREQVEMLILKGLFIGQRFSGGIDKRFMWDADILVHQHHLVEAIGVAELLGLERAAGKLPMWLMNLLNLHALEVSHRGQAIDIHWRIRNRPGYAIDYKRIWREAQPIELDGQLFNRPADEDALAMILLEIGGDMARSRIKARSLWDSYQMLRELDKSIDWDTFFQRRQQEGLLSLTVNMLSLILHCLNCHEECPTMIQQLKQQPARVLISDRHIALRILERPQRHLANRALYAKLQPQSVPVYWARWLATYPLRFIFRRSL